MSKQKIECNSEVGTTIALLDAIICLARQARPRMNFDDMICGERGDEYQPVRDALADLSGCQELRELIGLHDSEAMRIIHAAAALLEADSD